MSGRSNLESIVKAAHDKGHTFVYWRVHRTKSTPVVYAVMLPAPKRKETK